MRMRPVWPVALLLISISGAFSVRPDPEVVAELEQNLRSLFGFKGRPKVDRAKLVIPQALKDLYERQSGRKLETTSIRRPGLHTQMANTVRSYTHVEGPIDAKFNGPHRYRLKFNVSHVPKNERLKAAEIVINRNMIDGMEEDKEEDDSHYFQRIKVLDIIRPGIKGKREAITRVIDSKLIDTRTKNMVSVDVLPAVERWYDDPKNNYGIIISVRNIGLAKSKGKHPKKHLRLKRDLQTDWSQKQPVLITYTDDGRYKQRNFKKMFDARKKRATKGKKREFKKDICRRHPMRVVFEDVGWNDWIVAPQYYDAYYCKGECNFPFAEHMNTTNHGIVQSLINSVTPLKVPKICCIPTSLSAISMLYVGDDNNVTLKNYKDMVVTGCGCR